MKKSETGSYVDPNDKGMDRVKLQAFPFVLQALYNVTTMLGAKLTHKEFIYHGNPITASLVDSKIITDTLMKFGLYPKYKSTPDPNTGLRMLYHFSNANVDAALKGMSDYLLYRDNYVDSLKSHMAEMCDDYADIKEDLADLKQVLMEQEEVLDQWFLLLREAMDILAQVAELMSKSADFNKEAQASGLTEKVTALSVKITQAVQEDSEEETPERTE